MIDVDEARGRLFGAAPRLEAEPVALSAAAGRVLAASLHALRNQPPFPASAMDGYAVRAADLEAGAVRVVGEAAAGRRYAHPLGPSEAARIFTGAPVPEGADTILIQEDADVSGDMLRATEQPLPGAYIRPASLDFAAGDLLLAAGTRLRPRHIALAGAGGHAELSVVRRPRVAFLATGDELVLPGHPTGPDDIVASTTPALSAMIAEAGASPVDLGIAPDDRATIVERARAGLAEADILVTLGGASVGEHDLVKPALSDLGIELEFWKVAVRPGKPLMFAHNPLVLGLPGNPVSGLVCAILFLVPLIEAMQGVADPGPRLRNGILGEGVGANGPRRDHLRASFRNGKLHPASVQDSSMLSVLSRADALIVRAPHAAALPAGAPVPYISLDADTGGELMNERNGL